MSGHGGYLRVTEPVRLVVDHQVPMPDGRVRYPQHRIDRPRQVATQGSRTQCRRPQLSGVAAHRVVGGQVFGQQVTKLGQRDVAYRTVEIATGERDFEVELAEPV